jgi:N-methylhydantoinase A
VSVVTTEAQVAEARAIAVDVGGTFTDFVVRNADNSISTYKSSTTPGKIADGIFNGLALIAQRRGISVRTLVVGCRSFACGTTVATNAILEHKVAKTGMICTEGFRDTLVIREGGKADTYNQYMDYPEPYLPRYLTFGVPERINAEGGIETPLNEPAVRAAVTQLREWRVEAIAVSLLWSIANPVHELRIGEIIADMWPEVPYSLGHSVNPTIREYRRASATAIDASLKPVVFRSIDEIRTRLAQDGFGGVLTLITSNGGRTAVEEVLAKPVYLCLSGPSAICQAGTEIVRREGIAHGNIITVDMGGTSFDISITSGWTTPMHRQGTIGNELFGVPSVEVLTIGAGGGSIARVDAGGFIHVGPESAGAMPGPACYDRGGARPTVTDANLVRGLLEPAGFADGQMTLSRSAAEAAILTDVAKPLHMSIEEAASLICLTTEQSMVGAIEQITVRRGIDPREFVLVSGGSAGGVHAAAIARELGMKQVIIPRAAGVLSAFGIDRGDIKFNFARSQFTTTARFDHDRVNAVLRDLEADGIAYLDRMGVPTERRILEFSTEARYAGQVWQLSLPLPRTRIETDDDLANLTEAFHRLHEQFYSVRADGDAVEFTEWNLVAIGRADLPEVASRRKMSDGPATSHRRRAFLKEAGGELEIAVYKLDELPTEHVVAGPALIQDKLTVTLVPPQATAWVTQYESVMISLE